jgi:hypothetical protein
MTKDKKQPKFVKILSDYISELENRFGGGRKAIWEFRGGIVYVKIYTDGHVYSIEASPNYLGCQVATRKPRPGENWTRGNDLADGNFIEETWVRIIKDIVSYELKSISSYVLDKAKSLNEES